MRKIILLLSLVNFTSHAQSWIKKFSCDGLAITAKEVLPHGSDFYVLGSAHDTINNQYYGTVLSKINALGKPVWMKKYSFTTLPFNSLHGLLKSRDGSLLFLLQYGNTGAVVKSDTAGNFLWGKSFGMNYFFPFEMEETTNGNIIVAGINEHHNPLANVFVIRLDSIGNTLQYYDFASTYQWNAQLRLGDILRTKDGGCILIGSINMNYPVNGVFLAKIDSLGATNWTISLTHTGNESGISIAETGNGFIYMGRDGKNLLIGKIDKGGNPVWNKTYEGILYPWPWSQVLVKNNVIEVSSLIILDSSNINPRNILIFRTDTLGNFISGKVFPDSIYNHTTYELDRKECGNYTEHILLHGNYENGYRLFKNDTAFLGKCHITLMPINIISGVLNKVIVNSCFPGSITTSSFSGITNLMQLKEENVGNCESNTTTEISYNPDERTINIFPNPTSGTISIDAQEADILFHVYNSTGEKISCRVDQNKINLSAQPKGIYFVEIITEEKRTVKKIILE